MKKIAVVLVTLLVLLVAVVLFRTLMFRSVQLSAEPAAPLAIEADAAAERLAASIGFPTISHHDETHFDGAPFLELHDFLAGAFPRAHEHLQREVVNDYSLLYTWPGADPALPPALFLAHLDVVPVDEGTEAAWTHPPFEGVVAEGTAWGRGALDNKAGVLGMLEAVEALLGEGFAPARTLLFAFGHDEEIGGDHGAARIAALLRERGVRPLFSLDEGMAIVQDIVPGIAAPVALIGLAEKGYASLELTAQEAGGHSSQPPPQTSIGILAAAVAKLEAEQMPARLAGPIQEMFLHLGPEMSFPMRAAFANLWLTRPLLLRALGGSPATNAAIRTTTAPTMIRAGTKDNVLPITARAVVNFRILPGDTVETVQEHVERVIADPRVEVRVMDEFAPSNPTPVASAEGPAYAMINRAVRQVFAEALVAPALVVGGTDSKHYQAVAQECYRLQPVLLTQADLQTIHGTDEHIDIENYARAIRIYAQVMRNAGAG